MFLLLLKFSLDEVQALISVKDCPKPSTSYIVDIFGPTKFCWLKHIAGDLMFAKQDKISA